MKDRSSEPPGHRSHPPLDSPLATDQTETLATSVTTAHLTSTREMPEFIGGYRIIGPLGEGGMGMVWEAEQLHPRRRVAVKVLRQERFKDEVQARMFEREAESLGRLKHPNIAAIYESGRTCDGHGFFAMELVLGQTLNRWLGGRPSSISREELGLRLALFQEICGAVNYAHQRGVIHRDLKPSNIVVTDESAGAGGAFTGSLPAVKIVDFGLARITDPEVPAASLLTEMGVIRGTLQYMSPEQALGNAHAVDVRTDVYTLGIILYELLSGSLPYELPKSSLAEAVRVICEVAPRRLRETWSGVRRLDPDLETIVGRALEKDPDRRYPSAAALSEDIERYLTSQPIVARRPSRAYRARKFLRRHRVGASVAAALLLMVLAFATTMAVQAERIARERDRANREAEASQRVSDFMAGMFKVSDPSEARGNSITAREILDRASKEIDSGLAKDPGLQARLMHTMGNVYSSLGLYPQAESLLARAVETNGHVLGSEHPETLRVMRDVAILNARQGRYVETERIGRQVLAVQRRVLGPDHPELVRTLNNIAIAAWYQGHYDQAEGLYREALGLARRLFGSDDPRTLGAMNNTAVLYMAQGHYPEAETLFAETLEILRRVSGPDHPDTLNAMYNLGVVYERQGRITESEKLHRETLDLRHRVFGPDHPDTLQSMSSLADAYYQTSRFAEAERLHYETLDRRRVALGPDHPDTLESMNSLANAYDSQGRHVQAQELYRETLDRRYRVLGPDNPDTLTTMSDMAEAYKNEGRYADAMKLYRETLDLQRRLFGSDDPRVARTLYGLGCVEALRHDDEMALVYLRESLDHGLELRYIQRMAVNPDLDGLRGEPRFAALLAEGKTRADEADPTH